MHSTFGRAGRMFACLPGLLLACAVLLAGATAAEAAYDTSRIVSIGGDMTEVLYALGLAERIVAVDTTSHHPPEALREKKNVGYMRALSSEGVLSMNPTVIIASGGAGPPEVVAALKASSVPYVEINCEDTPEGVVQKVRRIAEAVGADGAGLAARVEADFKALAEERARGAGAPVRALFVIAVQNGRAIVGGRNTPADAIFRLAGAENAAAEIEGFKPLSDEAALTIAPDVIVTMRQEAAAAVASVPGLSATPAAKAGRILAFDGSYLLQFGPRAASAARDLMQALRAGATAPAAGK